LFVLPLKAGVYKVPENLELINLQYDSDMSQTISEIKLQDLILPRETLPLRYYGLTMIVIFGIKYVCEQFVPSKQ
jgi:hypothetical protein